MPELSVVIPTYNEKENIAILVSNITDALAGISYEIIVVDDQSPDGTGEAVATLTRAGYPIRLLTKEKKEGIGAALRHGYESCSAPIIASIDADLSFNAQDLRRLHHAIESGHDMVIGTRHSKHSFYETPNRSIWTKYIVSLGGNRVLRTLTGIPVDDFTVNFRAFTKKAWQTIETHENTNFLLFEMILKAHVKNCQITQIPVSFHDRRYGTSKLKLSWEIPKFFSRLIRHLYQHRRELARKRFRR